jgi:hypothetical protein
VCGRIRRAAAISLLKPRIDLADVDLRSATLRALSQCGYRVLGADRAYVQLLAIPKDVFLKHWGITPTTRRSLHNFLLTMAYRCDGLDQNKQLYMSGSCYTMINHETLTDAALDALALAMFHEVFPHSQIIALHDGGFHGNKAQPDHRR